MVRRAKVKTDKLYVRIAPTVKRAAARAADMDRRTLSSLIEWLLVEHCRQRGISIEKPGRKRIT